MSKISVVYWSQTGNTQAMAEAVGAGIAKAGKEADVVEVSSASMEDLKAAKVFALGCPAMGAEVLEEMEMEPFVENHRGIKYLKDKPTVWATFIRKDRCCPLFYYYCIDRRK
mgnify:CR=1 FL=1